MSVIVYKDVPQESESDRSQLNPKGYAAQFLAHHPKGSASRHIEETLEQPVARAPEHKGVRLHGMSNNRGQIRGLLQETYPKSCKEKRQRNGEYAPEAQPPRRQI